MSLIDRASTFRGRITDHGVSKSTNGYPQWVASLVALEIYDAEDQVWVDWSGYDVNEITAYLVLFGGKGETLAVQQLKKITGWNGLAFSDLNSLDLSETKIQFRVEENTYEGKTRLQVAWVDEYDAEPGRTVRKLDPEDLKALDAQYANLLKQSGKKVAPAKARQTATEANKAETPGKVTKKGVKPTQPKGPVKKVSRSGAKDPLGPDAAPPETKRKIDKETIDNMPDLPQAPPDPALPVGHCTKDEAWVIVNDLKDQEYTDDQIGDIWLGALQQVAPGVRQKDITDEQWFLVKEKVLEKTAKF